MSSGRYMAYSPSPSTAPQSPHLAGLLRSATSDLMEQEKYLTDLIAERQKLSPFVPVLPNSYRLLNQEILRVTTMLGTTSVIGQSGLEHANPLASGGLFPNGGADVNGWAPRFQSDVDLKERATSVSWSDRDLYNADVKALILVKDMTSIYGC